MRAQARALLKRIAAGKHSQRIKQAIARLAEHHGSHVPAKHRSNNSMAATTWNCSCGNNSIELRYTNCLSCKQHWQTSAMPSSRELPPWHKQQAPQAPQPKDQWGMWQSMQEMQNKMWQQSQQQAALQKLQQPQRQRSLSNKRNEAKGKGAKGFEPGKAGGKGTFLSG